MLLRLDPGLHAQMTEDWRERFSRWISALGFDLNTLGEIEYSVEACVLWATVYRTHPESGNFYFNPKTQEAASDLVIMFLDPEKERPVKIFTYEWERAMIAYQGRQGA